MTSVTVVGPGAIGCTIAGALVDRADVDLALVGRSPFPELRVEGLAEPLRRPVRFLGDPSEDHEQSDIVVVTTKTHQTPAIAGWLATLCGPETVVAVLQNGIGQRELVGPLTGEAAIVPAIVYFPADRVGPGHVTVALPATLEVPDDEAGRIIEDLFVGTFVDARPIADFHTTAWTKLVANCAVGAITTLTRTTNAVLADTEARALAIDAMAEAIAVGRADGAVLPPDLAETLVDLTLARAGHHVSSQTTDRLAGAPSEWDARQGEVVRRATRHGIDVPLLRTLTTLVRLGEPDVSE